MNIPYGIVDESRTGERALLLQGPWSDQACDFMRANDILGLRLSEKWPSEPLQFLSSLTFLKSLGIYDPNVRDLSPLYDLPHLESLSLDCPYRPFDFSRLPTLKSCYLNWRNGAGTIEQCKRLEYLNIDRFPREDLAIVAHFPKLAELHVTSRKMRTLNGLEAGRASLRSLTFSYCTALEDYDALRHLSSLETLEIYVCRKLRELDPLSNHPALSRLLVENCGSIDSLKSLSGCRHLEELFVIGTKIADWDLTPVEALPKLKNFGHPLSPKYKTGKAT